MIVKYARREHTRTRSGRLFALIVGQTKQHNSLEQTEKICAYVSKKTEFFFNVPQQEGSWLYLKLCHKQNAVKHVK